MANIQINDANFYYELHGQGHPLVLISGYASDHTSWLPLLDKLSKHFQVLIFDNRGVGQTRDANIALSAELMAQDVVMLCDQLGLHQPHIIGRSMGGMIAQTLAIRFPDKLNKLVLLNTAAEIRLPTLFAFQNSLEMRKNNVPLSLLIDNVMPWLFGEKFLQNKKNVELVKQAITNNLYPQSIEDQTRQLEALKSFAVKNQLKDIKAETLVIYGDEDIIVLPSDSKYLANHITDAKLIGLQGGHGLPSEDTQALLKTLIDYL